MSTRAYNLNRNRLQYCLLERGSGHRLRCPSFLTATCSIRPVDTNGSTQQRLPVQGRRLFARFRIPKLNKPSAYVTTKIVSNDNTGNTKCNPHQASITYTPLKSPESLWCSHRTAFTSASRAPKNFVIASSSISYESYFKERRSKEVSTEVAVCPVVFRRWVVTYISDEQLCTVLWLCTHRFDTRSTGLTTTTSSTAGHHLGRWRPHIAGSCFSKVNFDSCVVQNKTR